MKLIDDDGAPVDATISVERHDNHVDVIMHSRGGTRGSTGAKNTEYAKGLALVLRRGALLGARLLDAVVDSKGLSGAPLNARRLNIGRSYPFDLDAAGDAIQLGRSIGRAQVAVGRTPGRSKGGNSTRKIRLCMTDEGRQAINAAEWSHLLSRPPGAEVSPQVASSPAAEIAAAAALQQNLGEFDPTDETDARRSVFRALAIRQGHAGFRNRLLRSYSGRCSMTDCSLEPVLEAAHVVPYRGAHTNHVQNGLLLRADIHTLFDRNLLSIRAPQPDPNTWRVVIAPTLIGSEYARLNGKPPRLPRDPSDCPSLIAIREHRKRSGL